MIDQDGKLWPITILSKVCRCVHVTLHPPKHLCTPSMFPYAPLHNLMHPCPCTPVCTIYVPYVPLLTQFHMPACPMCLYAPVCDLMCLHAPENSSICPYAPLCTLYTYMCYYISLYTSMYPTHFYSLLHVSTCRCSASVTLQFNVLAPDIIFLVTLSSICCHACG